MFKRLAGLSALTCIAACTAEPVPEALDKALETSTLFRCDDGAEVSMRFLGPETIELQVDGDRRVLMQERSASGARYVTEQISFWNKGDEAMLDVDGARTTCRIVP